MNTSVTTNANIVHAENANATKGRYAGAVQVFFFKEDRQSYHHRGFNFDRSAMVAPVK